jgi:hypothetical protein
MISAWLDLPVIGVFACLIVGYGLTAALIGWLTFRSPLSDRIQEYKGLSPSYFASVAVLFALLTGFLAGEVMDRNRLAIRAIQVESSTLSNLHALTLASPADTAAIRDALRSYVAAIVNDEWSEMMQRRSSAKTEDALNGLLQAIADPRIAPRTGQAVHNGMINLTLQAATARSDRLALNSHQSDTVKWSTVLLLCLMTQIALGMVHLDRLRAHAAALAIFSVAAVIALGMIAIQEDPFDGALRVSPAPFEWLLKIVAT